MRPFVGRARRFRNAMSRKLPVGVASWVSRSISPYEPILLKTGIDADLGCGAKIFKMGSKRTLAALCVEVGFLISGLCRDVEVNQP